MKFFVPCYFLSLAALPLWAKKFKNWLNIFPSKIHFSHLGIEMRWSWYYDKFTFWYTVCSPVSFRLGGIHKLKRGGSSQMTTQLFTLGSFSVLKVSMEGDSKNYPKICPRALWTLNFKIAEDSSRVPFFIKLNLYSHIYVIMTVFAPISKTFSNANICRFCKFPL